MTVWQKLTAAVRRLGSWLLAAAILLSVLFVSVLIYKYLGAHPSPPDTAQCHRIQQLNTADEGAEVHLYQCQRGSLEQPWMGYEVWLYKVSERDWERLATAPHAACLSLSWHRPQHLLISHTGQRSEVYIVRPSAVYQTPSGTPDTLTIDTRVQAQCEHQ